MALHTNTVFLSSGVRHTLNTVSPGGTKAITTRMNDAVGGIANLAAQATNSDATFPGTNLKLVQTDSVFIDADKAVVIDTYGTKYPIKYSTRVSSGRVQLLVSGDVLMRSFTALIYQFGYDLPYDPIVSGSPILGAYVGSVNDGGFNVILGGVQIINAAAYEVLFAGVDQQAYDRGDGTRMWRGEYAVSWRLGGWYEYNSSTGANELMYPSASVVPLAVAISNTTLWDQ